MADCYRIFGAEMSPYSVKARSYFRYKAIPHQMDFVECGKPGRIREICQDADYSLVVTPEGVGVQDSVPAAAGCLAGLRS